MITVRSAHERGHANHGWLDTWHTFSFGQYYDPENVHFRALRVLNDDTVAPGAGFGTHPHNDMEIVTYVTEGALEHRDSMGTGSVIRAGDVQRMSAGTGVTHSEYNHSDAERVKFLQIWLFPERKGLEPGYEQNHFEEGDLANQLRLIASRDGRDGSLTVHQDVSLFASKLEPGAVVDHRLDEGRYGWLHVVDGSVQLNGVPLEGGDGAAIEEEDLLHITADRNSEILLFDLA